MLNIEPYRNHKQRFKINKTTKLQGLRRRCASSTNRETSPISTLTIIYHCTPKNVYVTYKNVLDTFPLMNMVSNVTLFIMAASSNKIIFFGVNPYAFQILNNA